MAEVPIERSFPSRYQLKLLTEMPHATERYYYPGARTDSGRDGLLIQVLPTERAPWVGVFAFGDSAGITAVWTMPDPGRLCVVSGGAGYLVDVEHPTHWEDVKCHPVRDVRVVVAHGMIVFADYTDLTAYDAAGVRWKSGRIAWDDLTILSVTAGQIVGSYPHYADGERRHFTVDLATGAVHGEIARG